MKFLRDIWDGLLGPYVIAAVFMAYIALCFMFFDMVRLTNVNTQILIGIAPFLALGFWAWKNGKVR
jgi:hypothetical protein